ncbi:Uu.00g059950.m01.CDS01 [Anthostomella pinea]|uniref:Uu.00g059950.m01.CDS01 n=1 Tax=Anthostomella pinea TaxID=933095 RepID=A0AAI8VS67_9PEZI|nr:Uu.00g059950.m01.CDS01 [Anthostomella pinea]
MTGRQQRSLLLRMPPQVLLNITSYLRVDQKACPRKSHGQPGPSVWQQCRLRYVALLRTCQYLNNTLFPDYAEWVFGKLDSMLSDESLDVFTDIATSRVAMYGREIEETMKDFLGRHLGCFTALEGLSLSSDLNSKALGFPATCDACGDDDGFIRRPAIYVDAIHFTTQEQAAKSADLVLSSIASAGIHLKSLALEGRQPLDIRPIMQQEDAVRMLADLDRLTLVGAPLDQQGLDELLPLAHNVNWLSSTTKPPALRQLDLEFVWLSLKSLLAIVQRLGSTLQVLYLKDIQLQDFEDKSENLWSHFFNALAKTPGLALRELSIRNVWQSTTRGHNPVSFDEDLDTEDDVFYEEFKLNIESKGDLEDVAKNALLVLGDF